VQRAAADARSDGEITFNESYFDLRDLLVAFDVLDVRLQEGRTFVAMRSGFEPCGNTTATRSSAIPEDVFRQNRYCLHR
jgi:hypothetical protein